MVGRGWGWVEVRVVFSTSSSLLRIDNKNPNIQKHKLGFGIFNAATLVARNRLANSWKIPVFIWNYCYESLKEIGVNVDEIWRKMLGFRVSIGLLPLILIVLWNETLLSRSERNWSWCWWDMKENVRFQNKYKIVTLYFDCLVKWNPVTKVWKKLELMLMRYEG